MKTGAMYRAFQSKYVNDSYRLRVNNGYVPHFLRVRACNLKCKVFSQTNLISENQRPAPENMTCDWCVRNENL
jgi:hypothetical protein